jgi:hypothetical protein
MSAQLSHTIEVKKGPFMRLFLWTYRPNEATLNSCHLFWGFIFMILAVPAVAAWRFLLAPVLRPIGDLIDDWDASRRARKRAERDAYYDAIAAGEIEPDEPKEKKPGRFLPAVSNFFSTVWFKTAPILPWVGRAILVAMTLWVGYTLIFEIDYSEFFDFAWKMLAVLVAIIAAFAVLVFLCWLLFEKWDVGRAVKSGGRAFHDHTCANVRLKDEG